MSAATHFLSSQKSEHDVIDQYLSDIAGSQPLSRECEVELAERIKQGDLSARDELVQANLRFVISVAKEYQNLGLSLPDLISAGNMGLIIATERFDHTKGYKFISYAVWWIRQSILQEIAEHMRTIRLPSNRINLLIRAGRERNKLAQEIGREPSNEELAGGLDVSLEMLEDTLNEARVVFSLDDHIAQGRKRGGRFEETQLLKDIIPDSNADIPGEGLDSWQVKLLVDELLKEFNEREKHVILRYFGFDGDAPVALDQIGRELKVTRERVRQIKERALRILRRRAVWGKLQALCDVFGGNINKDQLKELSRDDSRKTGRKGLLLDELSLCHHCVIGEGAFKHLLDRYELICSDGAEVLRLFLDGTSMRDVASQLDFPSVGKALRFKKQIMGWLKHKDRLDDLLAFERGDPAGKDDDNAAGDDGSGDDSIRLGKNNKNNDGNLRRWTKEQIDALNQELGKRKENVRPPKKRAGSQEALTVEETRIGLRRIRGMSSFWNLGVLTAGDLVGLVDGKDVAGSIKSAVRARLRDASRVNWKFIKEVEQLLPSLVEHQQALDNTK